MRARTKWILGTMVLLGGLFAGAGYVIYGGGRHEGPGKVHPRARAAEALAARAVARVTPAEADTAAPAHAAKQILFGDLHVHTTFSADAFLRSLPLLQGEGAHPPADACDFARFCSGLDFFALTDHAESLTPAHWREIKDSVRQCNAVAGGGADPDLVAFAGFEWSQVGATPADHYGHKNVIFRDLDEAQLPVRPIAAPGLIGAALRNPGGTLWQRALVPLRDFAQRQRYLDFEVFQRELAAVPDCPRGVDVHALPDDCREVAATPRELYEKIAQWGFDTLVIPHGSTWGLYTPPGYTWDKQLTPAERDPEHQRLVEVYSGHGNSEEYRAWRDVEVGASGEAICPAPTAAYEPCCFRAGEIIRKRCGAAPAEECARRVADARANYLAAGVAGNMTVPGTDVDDWGDCGVCRDCFLPSFQYRPGGAVQYMLAIGERFGFIASSDNHSARPGTGYKEFGRRGMTEATGARSPAWDGMVMGARAAAGPVSTPFDAARAGDRPPFQLVHIERQASFFLSGGLVAVHALGRSRQAIWAALLRREVYGTSGPQMLLWFDLVNAPDGSHPMGAEVAVTAPPHFVVRAVGAFVQRPGCPADVTGELSPAELARLCLGECDHPSDQRQRITRIEVVRIRPRRDVHEPLDGLIEDPWRRLDCPPDPAGCRVEFDDPDLLAGGREALYYVRAVQEPTPAVNAGNLRCARDASGACARTNPCYGDYRTPFGDDCLAPAEERAWSSPIFVRPAESTR